jgi:hypothetical protein
VARYSGDDLEALEYPTMAEFLERERTIIFNDLLHPKRLWSRQEVLSQPSLVPRAPGVYAWYFRDLDSLVPSQDCIAVGEFRLLYIGISPNAPPSNGKPPSKKLLNDRIRNHMQGNAYGSTLRLSLGCILSKQLGIHLRRVGSGKGLTFSTGEQRLSEWLEGNARVTWLPCEKPWTVEAYLISKLNLPLNLLQNSRCPFFTELSNLRKDAKNQARELPILGEK